jgi:flagellar hook-associated protein 2
VGEGTLTFRFGTTDYSPADPGPESYNGFAVNAERDAVTINIDSSNNTVQGVADAINAADAGITAVTVNDGGGVRLLISSEQTGAANSIEISVDDTGDNDDGDNAGLSRLAFNASDNNLSQTTAGRMRCSVSTGSLSVARATPPRM